MPPSQRKYDFQHQKNLDTYAFRVRKAYLAATKDISNLTYKLSLNSNDEFYFRNNPSISKKVDAILKEMYSEVYGVTVSGINSEWELAVEKNNELARYAFGKDLKKLPPEFKQKYLSGNDGAKRAFASRKVNGLNLSDRVFKNTKQFKTSIELALEAGIGQGRSAAALTKDVKSYLNEPDKLFRKIRDKPGGELRLSKAAKDYHPGQGVYRSSYKNALRLTANETNFSYESSQHEKRKQQDFIVGIEISTSPRHVLSDDKGGICCDCLQGRYPKDFDWTYKWHVNCRCYSKNIIKSREEINQDIDKILAGGEPNTPSKREVKKMPSVFNSYIKENGKKWENWKNPPRFLASA